MMKKLFIILGCVSLAWTLYVLMINNALYNYNAPPRQGRPEVERDFRRDEELIFTIRDYLSELEYDWIPIYSYDNLESLYIPSEGFISIADAEASEAIRQLLGRGYRSIIKRENCIIFTRWGNLGDLRGVVYSIDGQIPDGASWGSLNLTKLEPLSPEGWYYFETTEKRNTIVLPSEETIQKKISEFDPEQS